MKYQNAGVGIKFRSTHYDTVTLNFLFTKNVIEASDRHFTLTANVKLNLIYYYCDTDVISI